MAGSDTVQSVERALDVLQALAGADGGLRLRELAEQLNLNNTTVHNLTRTLIGRSFVVKGQNQRLRIGPAVGELLAQALHRVVQHSTTTASLDLQRTFPEGIVNVAEVVDSELMVLIRLSGDRPGLVQRPNRQVAHLYGSAVGLCALAFADQGTVQDLREKQSFHETATRLWPSLDALDQHLANARAAGQVVTPFPGQELWRIAAPVFGADGSFRAAVGLALPVARADDDCRRLASTAIIAAAATIAQER